MKQNEKRDEEIDEEEEVGINGQVFYFYFQEVSEDSDEEMDGEFEEEESDEEIEDEEYEEAPSPSPSTTLSTTMDTKPVEKVFNASTNGYQQDNLFLGNSDQH